MHISVTKSPVGPSQSELVGKFLTDFLPKVKKTPGVIAVYHYDSPDEGETTTIIVWKDEEALMAYRRGELIKSAIEFEMKNGLKSTRRSYPLTIAL